MGDGPSKGRRGALSRCELDNLARRCPDCGRGVTQSDDACPGCGAPLSAICTCGETFRRDLDTCPACGEYHAPAVYRSRLPGRRVVLVAVLVLVLVSAGGVVAYRQWRAPSPWEELAQADAAMRAGRFDEAQLRYARHVQEHGGNARVHYARGVALHALGKRAEAATEMRRVLERSPGHVDAALYLARAAGRGGDAAAALELANRVLTAEPDNAPAHLVAGQALSTPGLLDAARARWHLQQVLRDEELRTEARVLLAELEMRAGSAPGRGALTAEVEDALREAAADIRSQLLSEPDRDDLRLFLARVALRLDDPEQAWRQLESVRARSPDGAMVRSLAGRLLWLRGAQGEGKRELDAALAQDPGPMHVLEIAAFYEREERDDLAEEALRDARSRRPRDLTLRLHEARALLRNDRAAEAEERLRPTLETHPDSALPVLWLAEALLAQERRRSEAEELLRTSRGIAPTVALRLADLLLDGPAQDAAPARDAVEEARALLDGAPTAVSGSPTDVYALYVRGKLALVERRLGEARRHLSSVLERNPRDPHAHLLLARLHEERGDHDLAVLELTAALRESAPSAELLVRRARARLADPGGSVEAARDDAAEALGLDPGSDTARIVLARALARSPGSGLDAAEGLLREGLGERASAALRLELARVAAARGRLDDARALCEEVQDAAAGAGDRLAALLLRAAIEDAAAGSLLSAPARALLDGALADRPRDTALRIAYAERLLRAGDPTKAASVVTPVLGAPGAGTAPLRLLFEALVGDPDARADSAEVAARLERVAPGSTDALYAAGRSALESGEPARALESLRMASDRAPRDADVANALATALLRTGELKEARRVLEHAVRVSPRYSRLRLLLAEVSYRDGRAALHDGSRDAGVEALLGALERNPGHVPARVTLLATHLESAAAVDDRGWSFAREQAEELVASLETEGSERTEAALRLLLSIAVAQRDWDQVAEAAAALHALDPQDVEAARQHADALVVAGRADEAVAVLAPLLGDGPEAWPVLRGLAEAQLAAGRPDEGVRIASKWLSSHPDDARAHMLHGWLLDRVGRPAEAESALRAALERDASLEGAALALVDVLLRDGRWEEAERALSELAARHAPSASLEFERGRVLLRGARFDEGLEVALAAFRRGIEEDLRWARCAGTLLEALLRADRPSDLETVTRDVLERGRSLEGYVGPGPGARWLADAYLFAAVGLHARGDTVRAEHAYRQALATREDLPVAHNNLAELLASDAARRSERVLSGALAHARRAVALASEVPEYRDTLGFVLTAAGQPDAGARELRTAAAALRRRAEEARGEDGPRQSLARTTVRLAHALLAAERVEEAEAALREALTAWPSIREDPAYGRIARRLGLD